MMMVLTYEVMQRRPAEINNLERKVTAAATVRPWQDLNKPGRFV